MKPATKAPFLLLVAALAILAEVKYQKPPKAVLDVLNAPATPILQFNPTRTYAVEARALRNPPIAELAQPMLRIAGLRINPKTNGLHNATFESSLMLRKTPDGTPVKVELPPPNPKLGGVRWSPDGKQFAFTNTTAAGIELWVADTTGKSHRVEGVRVNGVMGGGRGGAGGGGRGGLGFGGAGGNVQWMPDGKSLLVFTVSPNRGPVPAAPVVPVGPHVQESLGGGAPAPTLEDMLQNPHDEELFVYYATSQLASVDPTTGKVTPIGKPAILENVHVSPNGKDLLVTSIHKPFSYLHSYNSFPKEIDVWDLAGKKLHQVANLPLEDKVPLNGVLTGPRNVQWRASEPATVLWVEALDGGDLKNQVPFRDKLMALKAPFTGEPVEIFKTEARFAGMQMAAKGGFALAADSDRKTRRIRTFIIDLDKPGQPGAVLWSRNQQDRYHDPGSPEGKLMPNGQSAILMDGDNIFLTGLGASPTGDHPFLDRFNLSTKQSERLFECDNDHYETVVALLDDHASKFITRRESPTEPPNYFVRAAGGTPTAMTKYPDPQPSIRGISKQLVKYNRADGVELQFTLYLPAGYQPGTKLPTVVWAYPYEYNDAATASQVSGSTKRFTEMTGYSELFFALGGYAVLANTAMPIIGDPDSVNDHFVDQVVADAKAAVDKAVAMGVADPARIGVGGHSYGAFMTDTLLAHSNLFKAGIAESGAPNRTLTPFGFQNERRTIWQAPETYLHMSPFMYADKIKAPILFIHGEADDNSGTFPIQSERMYEAVRGNGGITRLVFLPHEAHGYRAKETVEHVLWEKITWFDKYVKGVPTAATNN